LSFKIPLYLCILPLVFKKRQGNTVFFLRPLSTIKTFIDQINESLSTLNVPPLSRIQKFWLATCITGILVTNSVCWKKIEQAGLGRYGSGTLSAMFRRGKIYWEKLLQASVLLLLKKYEITEGMLALDGTDNKRSKNTKKIAKVHKMKDKPSGGFVRGQELTMLVLITEKITIPVGFAFYEPDPDYIEWKKKDKQLKKQGISKKARTKPPEKRGQYPSTIEVAVELLETFRQDFPDVKIKAILADALYGAKSFFQPVSKLFKGVQIISQAKKNQSVCVRGKYITVEEYFRRNPGVPKLLKIRGGEEQTVTMHGARLKLKAHGCKRFLIALKYEGEENYRYLLASDLTWRLTDIAAAYTFRWLVEVFIQDWKGYEGWCQLAKQPGVEGSCRGVILSLLVDHSLLLHPDQLALVNNKLPAATVGSLRDRERAQAVLDVIEDLLADQAVEINIVADLRKCVDKVVPLRPSKKHMSNRELGRIEPTHSLKYLAAA
jgi:hypothetical protein